MFDSWNIFRVVDPPYFFAGAKKNNTDQTPVVWYVVLFGWGLDTEMSPVLFSQKVHPLKELPVPAAYNKVGKSLPVRSRATN